MLNILDFGGDPTGVNANDSALASAISSVTENVSAWYAGGPRVYFPPGKYRFDATIHLKKTVIIEGDAVGQNGGYASSLVFPVDVHGIVVHRYNTVGETVEAPPTTAGDATIIRNLELRGAGAKVGTKGYGIWLRARATIDQVRITDFRGDGVHIVASEIGSGEFKGNANNFHISNCRITACGGHGVFIDGADANAGVLHHVDSSGNEGWGFWDSSFLGNCYVGCHTNGNGRSARVYHNSAHWMSVKPANTAEPGTAATHWWRVGNSAGPSTAYLAWSSLVAYPEGGGYKTDNTNQQTVLLGCYNEGGQPAEFAARTIVFGGTIALADLTGNNVGTIVYGSNFGMTANKLGLTADVPAGGVIELGLLQNPANGEMWFLRHPQWSNGQPHRLKFTGTTGGQIELDYQNSPSLRAFAITGPLTTQTFGRASPVPHAFYADRLMIGANMTTARRHTSGSAAPATGDWARGDVCWNTSPSAGGFVGWSCAVAGNPGTWKGFGLIEA